MSTIKTTVGELRELLKAVHEDYCVRIVVPCRNLQGVADIEKNIVDIKPAHSRKLVLVECEILDLGPK